MIIEGILSSEKFKQNNHQKEIKQKIEMHYKGRFLLYGINPMRASILQTAFFCIKNTLNDMNVCKNC